MSDLKLKSLGLVGVRNLILCLVGKRTTINDLPKSVKKYGHGSVEIVHAGYRRSFRVHGGSFRNAPKGMFGVKLAGELSLPCQIDFPINDFSIPTMRDLAINVNKIAKAGLENEEIYVGCMGGYGRTGTVIAALLIAVERMTAMDAIERVRATIHPHCVETESQRQLLLDYETEIADMDYTALAKVFESGFYQ